MTFRFARHTNDLEKLQAFYMEVLGLELLGHFTNHDGYDGIFLGKPASDWHLEFTKSGKPASHSFDEDDILVFYPKTITEYKDILNRLNTNNIEIIEAENPYWNEHGKMFLDPDGYRIIISNLKI